MGFRVEITPPAEADIDQAFAYIREFSEPAAIRWVHGILRSTVEKWTWPATGCEAAMRLRPVTQD